MKWILINPPHFYLVNPNLRAPLGLLYIAAVLEDLKENVSVVNLSSKQLHELELEEADVYGITCTSIDIKVVEDLSKIIKTKYPKSKVIVGGVGANSLLSENNKYIDCLVVGEAEDIMIHIIDKINNNDLSKTILCPKPQILNSLPFPARHLYEYSLPINIISSRGCSWNCSFCSSPYLYEHKVRFRNAFNIYREIRQLKKEYNTNYFIFEDDMLTIDKERLLCICFALKDLDIRWRAMIRVKPLDKEMLQAMKDAGCDEVAVGVESFDNNVLKALNKGTTVKDNIKALEMIHSVGIKIRLLLMIRTPGQTKETMELNKKYLQTVPYDLLACTMFTPIPLSDIYNNPTKYNIEILDRDPTNYNYSFYNKNGINELKPVFKIKNRSIKEFHNETIEFQNWLIQYTPMNVGKE